MSNKNKGKPDAFIVIKEDSNDWDIVPSSVLDEYEYGVKADVNSEGSKQIEDKGE